MQNFWGPCPSALFVEFRTHPNSSSFFCTPLFCHSVEPGPVTSTKMVHPKKKHSFEWIIGPECTINQVSIKRDCGILQGRILIQILYISVFKIWIKWPCIAIVAKSSNRSFPVNVLKTIADLAYTGKRPLFLHDVLAGVPGKI